MTEEEARAILMGDLHLNQKFMTVPTKNMHEYVKDAHNITITKEKIEGTPYEIMNAMVLLSGALPPLYLLAIPFHCKGVLAQQIKEIAQKMSVEDAKFLSKIWKKNCDKAQNLYIHHRNLNSKEKK